MATGAGANRVTSPDPIQLFNFPFGIIYQADINPGHEALCINQSLAYLCACDYARAYAFGL